MDPETTGATSTPAEDDSVRAELEAAWGAAESGTTEPGNGSGGGGDKADPAAAETQEAADARARDERGRFAKKEDEPAAAEGSAPAAVAETAAAPGGAENQVTEPVAQAVAARPPPGWSVQSKAAWDVLPDHIRADIAKREAEVDAGFAQYAGMKDVKPYADMARQSGTTLSAALENYVGMEQLLRKDFREGVFAIAKNMGVSPQQFQQMFGGAPAGQPNQNGQTNGATDPAQADLDDPYVKAAVEAALRPVTQQLTTLQSNIHAQQQAAQNRELQSAETVVQEFQASDQYRYFSDVEGTINRLIERGMIELTGNHRADLATAYDMACQLHPEVREALVNDRISKTEAAKQAAAAKAASDKLAKTEAAKRASVSVRGAPSGPVSTPGGSRGDVRADLEAAWGAHS